MRTSDLVGILATEPRPHAHDSPRWRLATAAIAGSIVAFVAMTLTLRLRADLAAATALPMFWGKLLFTTSLAALALFVTRRVASPDGAPGWMLLVAPVPVLVMWAVGAHELANVTSSERLAVVLGRTWTVCPLLVTMLAAPVFAASVWALRGLAPTRLRLAGAAAGLFSGATGAAVYSLHCPEMAASFVGTWYLLGIVIPGVIGALMGPRLLRW